VLLECGNAASRTPFRHDVVEVRQHLSAAGNLVEPTESDCAAAWLAYSQSQAGEAGIVDQVSFAVMRRRGLVEAFTNDRHFRSAGFTTLF
jgi:predicted nucleic acid-binding protein